MSTSDEESSSYGSSDEDDSISEVESSDEDHLYYEQLKIITEMRLAINYYKQNLYMYTYQTIGYM